MSPQSKLIVGAAIVASATAYLAWLGIRGLRAKPADGAAVAAGPTRGSAARDGFLIVFLNPKIAVFFIKFKKIAEFFPKFSI